MPETPCHVYMVYDLPVYRPICVPLMSPCSAGCDNCRRRAAGELKERDVAVEARLLLSTGKVGAASGGPL